MRQAPPPCIETGRLLLAPHSTADFDDMAALWADPLVAGAAGMTVSTPAETWARLLRYGGLWALLGIGYWAVRDRASGRFVGDVGFADFHRDMVPSIRQIPEAGWMLVAWAHGRGYGREAVGAALAWLDARAARSVCLIGPHNAPSLRLAAALGYGVPRETLLGGRETLLLSRASPAQPAPPR
jgi:RimJ/RimL family protein N-acetyltransferase